MLRFGSNIQYSFLGMVFTVNIGFSGLQKKGADDKVENYVLYVGDTVLVNDVSVFHFFLKYIFLFVKFEFYINFSFFRGSQQLF